MDCNSRRVFSDSPMYPQEPKLVSSAIGIYFPKLDFYPFWRLVGARFLLNFWHRQKGWGLCRAKYGVLEPLAQLICNLEVISKS